ncbi:unnamed protein product [Callosobruchus maculatus]|uniref:Uncharacterized protein n=1 Tax=Callosobruchus maculatus TaxID=64391 RepID=A0A653CD98_CALMS|nr:unnamed protein product [Callosobruchus maculatus]
MIWSSRDVFLLNIAWQWLQGYCLGVKLHPDSGCFVK